MSLAIIIGIILLGLAFLFIEFFLIPGGGLVGVLGLLVMAGGVYLAYSNYSMLTGNLILGGALIGILAITVIGFRRISRLRWADKETIDSRVNELEFPEIKKGDKGIAFNNIKPNGTALINNQRVDVFSIGEFIDRETPIEVVKVEKNKVYVKPINL